jgi:hypothetical protein
MSADIMTPPGPRYGQPMSAGDKLVERARNVADNIGRELSDNSMLPAGISGVSDIWSEEGAIVLREAASALEASEAKIAALTADLRIAKETAVYERDRTDAAEGHGAALTTENATLREALRMIERLGPDWIGEIARAALRQEGRT